MLKKSYRIIWDVFPNGGPHQSAPNIFKYIGKEYSGGPPFGNDTVIFLSATLMLGKIPK